MNLPRAPLACALLAALGMVSAAGEVRAQGSAAEEHLQRGVRLREQGQDDAALAEFRQALELGHAPRALAQVAVAEQALGHWVEAEAHLEQALAATDPWVARHRAALDAALVTVRQHVGRLEVRGNVAGAEVRLGGVVVGALPFPAPARVLAGTATLEVRSPGYGPVERSVTVPPGGLAREVVELVELAAVVPAAPVPVRSTPAAPVMPVTPLVEVASRPGQTQRTLGWVAAGGAVAVLGGAAAMQILRDVRIATYDGPSCRRNGLTRMQNCHAQLDAADQAGTLAVAGFVVGGALAATAIVLFATAPRGRSAEHVGALRFGCGRGPGDLGIACEGRF